MNIFATSRDPIQCARSLDDKRIGKLLTEANQMLSFPAKRHISDWQKLVAPDQLCDGLRHMNHPIAVWVRRTSGNMLWTMAYGRALAAEFEYRYGRIHGSARRLPFMEQFVRLVPSGALQPFHNSARHRGLDIDFTHLPVHQAYRAYLTIRWQTDKRRVTFTNRPLPRWYKGSRAIAKS